MRIAFTIAVIFTTFLSINSFGQDNSYIARPTYTSSDAAISREINRQLNEEAREVRNSPFAEVEEVNAARRKYFRSLLDKKALISDSSMIRTINNVVKNLEEANELRVKPRRVFIVKDPRVNAQCLGNGVFLINTGLLGRISSEDELAFTIAHEIAHDELKHTHGRVEWLVEVKFLKKQHRRLSEIITGEVDFNDLKEFRDLNFAFSRMMRRQELEADSLAMILLQNTTYSEWGALKTLKVLDEHSKPKYELNAESFLQFHSKEFPFQQFWLNDRLTVFGRRMENDFLFNLDSLSSHPDIALRTAEIEGMMLDWQPEDKNASSSFWNLVRLSEFETVESAFYNRMFDRCLLQALILRQNYPQDSYLVSRIAGVFLQLYVAKEDGTTDLFVSGRTIEYSEELKLINNFLHNITTKETGEILYQYLKNPRNFDSGCKDHYFILWKLCDMTYRSPEAKELERLYKEKFDENIAYHKYEIITVPKLNLLDYIGQWGWAFGL